VRKSEGLKTLEPKRCGKNTANSEKEGYRSALRKNSNEEKQRQEVNRAALCTEREVREQHF